jgi:hypothetical protein
MKSHEAQEEKEAKSPEQDVKPDAPTFDDLLRPFPQLAKPLSRALLTGRFHVTVSWQEKLPDKPGDYQHVMETLNFPTVDITGCLEHMKGVAEDDQLREFVDWMNALEPADAKNVAEEAVKRLTRIKVLGRVYEMLIEKHKAEHDPAGAPAGQGKLR